MGRITLLLLCVQCIVVMCISPTHIKNIAAENRLNRILKRSTVLLQTQSHDAPQLSALTQAAAVSSFSDPSAGPGAGVIAAQIQAQTSGTDPAPVTKTDGSIPDAGGCVGCTAQNSAPTPATPSASPSSPSNNPSSNAPTPSATTQTTPSTPAPANSNSLPDAGGCVGCTAHNSEPAPATPSASPSPSATTPASTPAAPATSAASSNPTSNTPSTPSNAPSAPATTPANSIPDVVGGGCVGCTAHNNEPAPASPSSNPAAAPSSTTPATAPTNTPSNTPSNPSSAPAPPTTPASSNSIPDAGGCVGCTANNNQPAPSTTPSTTVPTPPPATPLPTLTDVTVPAVDAPSAAPSAAAAAAGTTTTTTTTTSSDPTDFKLPPVGDKTDAGTPPNTPCLGCTVQPPAENAPAVPTTTPATNGNSNANNANTPPTPTNTNTDQAANGAAAGACVGCTVQPPAENTPPTPTNSEQAGASTCVGCTVQPPAQS